VLEQVHRLLTSSEDLNQPPPSAFPCPKCSDVKSEEKIDI